MLAVQKNISVLNALIIRDLMSRFGRHHLGFVWTVLEPMILCTGVMIVWSVIKEPFIHGIPIITFVLTGYMPVTLWRHLTNSMTKLLARNTELLYHRQVSHVHILIARQILEFLSTTLALFIVYFVTISFGLVEPAVDLGLALAGWLLTAWYYGAMGLVIAAVTEYWEPGEKFIQPMQYLALPLSGMFFMVDWVPDYAQKLLLINPSPHCFEMFRAGFLGPAITAHYDVWYLVACSTAMTILAARLLYNARSYIQFT